MQAPATLGERCQGDLVDLRARPRHGDDVKALQKKIVRMCLESRNGGIVPGMATFALGVTGRQTRQALKDLRRQGLLTSIPIQRKNSKLTGHPGTSVYVWTVPRQKRDEANGFAG